MSVCTQKLSPTFDIGRNSVLKARKDVGGVSSTLQALGKHCRRGVLSRPDGGLGRRHSCVGPRQAARAFTQLGHCTVEIARRETSSGCHTAHAS